MVPRRPLLLALFALTACIGHRTGEHDPFATALAAADLRWAARAETGSVDEAERAYRALLAQRPDSGEVLWRLARVEWSRALIDPANASTWHEAGRQEALACIAADPALADWLAHQGDRLTTEVLTAAHMPAQCLVYGAAHVVRWVELRGAGAALDLEDAAPLLEVAASTAPTVEPALREWAAARVSVLSGGAPSAARAHFRAAVEAEPGLHFFRVDAADAFPDLTDALPSPPETDAWALENGAAPVSPAP